MEWIVIAVIAVGASLFTTFVLRKLGISTRMREIQKFTNGVNKEYFNALRKKDAKKLDELEPKMKESQKLSMETIKLNFKSMAIILPIAFGMPYIVQNLLFSTFLITLPFDIPIPFRSELLSITWRDTFGAYGWYWVSYIFFGGIAQIISAKVLGKKDDKKEEKK